MFNVSGPELLIILLLALVVLGPDKLPEAARKIGRVMSEVRRVSNGFQSELRDAMQEPVRATQETMDLAKGNFNEMAKHTPAATAPPDPVVDGPAEASLEALAAHDLGMVPDPSAPSTDAEGTAETAAAGADIAADIAAGADAGEPEPDTGDLPEPGGLPGLAPDPEARAPERPA